MANWITHTIIVDRILSKGLDLDKRGFCIGNIAPDCNIENEDWTEYTPPKEKTHWMSSKDKLTVNYKAFYNEYIKNKTFRSKEHYSFLLGYYAHLITDVEWKKFIRNGERVKASFDLIRGNKMMNEKIAGLPENVDTLKQVFGRRCVMGDIVYMEHCYLQANENASYNTILRKTTEFNDYIDYLPKGAIQRKIKIMAYEAPKDMESRQQFFCSQKDFEGFIEHTSDFIYDQVVSMIESNSLYESLVD